MASSSTQMIPYSSSSSSSSPFDSHSQWSWDVFLSFRGKDTRVNFTDHLYSALIRCNIKTFRDDESLRKGEEISPDLLQAIAESRVAVIVFSKSYAHSKWCLEELVKIMNCKEEKEQKVIPIFYHVDPSEVRNQKGIYEEPFARHEENADDEQKKENIRRWKTAMTEVGKLAGYHVLEGSYESKIIDDIIGEIHGIVPKVLDVNDNIVGMDSRLGKIISLLKIQFNDVRMVGVYGLGGIGKTTIITALHNKISNQFQSISFLTNIREESTNDSGLLKLQQQLVDDTLGVRGQLTLKNIYHGVKVIKDMLSSKKVLVFLDDVDDSRQLEHLVGKHSWFGHGSRIVITSRRKDLLTRHGVDSMYEVDKLNDEEALQLFCSYAFKQHLPGKGYEDLSNQVIRYADGLPLALKVLGSLFFGKGLKDWKSELKKLEQVPDKEITKVLKISYDGLDHMQKMIFLDIACFFYKENNMKDVTTILDASGFNAKSGINALVDKCFITISEIGEIKMHDLLTQLGKEIVYEECPNEPGERSRLWRHADVCRVLTRNTATKKIEIIILDDKSTEEQIKVTSEAFKRMNRLRVLAITNKLVQLPDDFSFPSYDLTYLRWDGYSLASLPSDFQANSLVCLILNSSNIKRLWNGKLCTQKLRRVDLSGSRQLIEIPEFSTMPNLEYLILSGCVSLENLPRDIHKLEHLWDLHCDGCSKLTSFPETKSNIGNIMDLKLDETAIKELPSSIGLLEYLHDLCLNNCKNLESLPDSICHLSRLKTLTLDGCSKLGKLPSMSVLKIDNCFNALTELRLRDCNLNGDAFNDFIFHLCSLEVLDLSGCNTEEGVFLSDMLVGISRLSKLRALSLSHCKKLPQIPELPSSLRLLNAHGSIRPSLPPMHSLVNCLKSANQDLEYKRSSNSIFVNDFEYMGQGICIVVEGSHGIPKWIRNQKEGYRININLPSGWYENDEFLGFAVCCVYVPEMDGCVDMPETESHDSAHESEIEPDNGRAHENYEIDFSEFEFELGSVYSTSLACTLTFGDEYESPPESMKTLFFRTLCKSYHYGDASKQMWVTLYPKAAIPEKFHSIQFKSLKARFFGPHRSCEVIKCGLQPIYAHDPTVQTRDVDVSCSDCQRNVNKQTLCLKGRKIKLCIPTATECVAAAVDTLCLRDCKSLESLPTSIWDEFSSLKSLFCSNCSKLGCFPQVPKNIENVRELHLDSTAIEEIPSSIEHFSMLEHLNLMCCQKLVTLPESIGNLRCLQSLNVSYCSNLQKLPQNLVRLKNLKLLFASGLNSSCCQSLSLSGLTSLRFLHLSDSKPMPVGVIRSEICCLHSLQKLDLSHCQIDEGGFPIEIGRLLSLVTLHLNENHFRSIPARINQLSELRVLGLSHCKELVQIEDLPSSLRVLDVHGCRWLGTSSSLLSSSLFKCFRSVIQDLEYSIDVEHAGIDVFITGRIGIPKWIRPQKKGSPVVAKLPQDWYKDSSDLLGFVLYSVIDESEAGQEMEGTRFKCDLTFLDHEHQLKVTEIHTDQFRCYCSGVLWMHYHPKVAIPKRYHLRNWKQLKASFCGFSDGRAMTVEECGIHLIYASDAHEQNPGKSIIPTFCRECQEDEQSAGYQLKLCANRDSIKRLPTIESSLQLDSLCLRGCKKLWSLPSSICELKSLTALFCSGCSQLSRFPEILQDMENLKQLHLDETAIQELPAASIQHLKGLQFLNLDYCNNLVSLPGSVFNCKSLTTLSCFGCSNLTSFPSLEENMENLKELYLGRSPIQEVPSLIENLRGLQLLNLKNCKKLASLPSTICELKSLTSLICSGCSQLRSFPEIHGDMKNLKWLYLDGTAITELPESVQHLQGLQILDLAYCNNLVRLPKSIGYLKSLIALLCYKCSNLKVIPEISENMEILEELDFTGTSIKELPSSIQHLRGLQNLYLSNCSNLVNIPESICKLSSLTVLKVNLCTGLEKLPENLGSLQCLEDLEISGLNLSEDCFSGLAADIMQLPKLRILNLSHCPHLSHVPDLPPTLRVLDVHNCEYLENLSSLSHLLDFSLLKCFKSAIEELECGSYWNKAIRVITPGNNGIPERIRHREKGSEITVELPPDWHINNDLLGFSIYSVFIPLASGLLNCELNFCVDGGSGSWDVDNMEFARCKICVRSDGVMCVAYYPKLAIEKHYWSKKWRHLKASFYVHDGLPVQVKECGFHLIYTHDIPEDTGTDTDDRRRMQDNTQGTDHNDDDQIMIEEYNDDEQQISCMHNWQELLCNFVRGICCGRF